MTIRVGINGFGRIGRNFFRAMIKHDSDVEIAAINDLMPPDLLAHLLQYDTTHGRLGHQIAAVDSELRVDSSVITTTAEAHPADIPWANLGVDIVVEATGRFGDHDTVRGHLSAGAQKVIVSAPSKEADTTIVMGANHQEYYPAGHHVISNASCTTNCLAPMANVLNESFGIRHGLMTTVHAYTADQNLQDGPHADLRRARAAGLNVVPTSTGAAQAIGKVLPDLEGKLDGFAMRVPVAVGSITDLTVTTMRDVTVEAVNDAFRTAAESSRWKNFLKYTELPLVSSDIVGDAASCVFDATLTRVVGNQIKVLGWYDNEWGYSSRLADLTAHVASHLREYS